jgi:hypothetical protein
MARSLLTELFVCCRDGYLFTASATASAATAATTASTAAATMATAGVTA